MLSLRRQGFNPKVEVRITRPGRHFADASVWKCGARIGRMNVTIPMVIVTFDRSATSGARESGSSPQMADTTG
jgi:hypothetical protein